MLKFRVACMKVSDKNIAQKHCVNWKAGVCLGCMLKYQDGVLYQWVDADMQGKQCFADKGCEYFKNIVLPAKEGNVTYKARKKAKAETKKTD